MIIDIVHGFLGSGKTTFIQQLLEQLTPLEKVVVLVNEFGQVGIDGALLRQGGSDVVELSSGCICCTLKADLSRQIPEIAAEFKPDRLIIEPSGVATIQSLLEVVGALRLEPYVQAVRVICIVDAGSFIDLYGASPMFVRTQLERANIIIINKRDLVDASGAGEIRKTISSINGRAVILITRYGRIGLEQLDAPPVTAGAASDGGGEHPRHHHHDETAQYQSFSRKTGLVFSRPALRQFFARMETGEQGRVIRAKGIFKCREGWVRFDFLPGNINETVLAGDFESSRIVVIGYTLEMEQLEREFSRCACSGGSGV